jgi:esterase/lipase superfamily enzyme
LFSWPAADKVIDYIHDYDHANWAAEHLQNVLGHMVDDWKPRHLHLIAHSMGTRVLVQAVNGLMKQNVGVSPLFDNIVLAAADLDPSMFDQTSPAMKSLSRRTTLYVCDCDWALTASRAAHDGPRIGLMKVSYPDMDVIDAGTADLLPMGLNHSYLLRSQMMLNDLFLLINLGAPPERRANIELDGCCWIFLRR